MSHKVQKFKFLTIAFFGITILGLTILIGIRSKTAAAQESISDPAVDPCPPGAGNVLANPGFESGDSSWLFVSNGQGSFSVEGSAAQCNNAAKITIAQTGDDLHLFQPDISLKPETNYILSFAAKSTSGNDFQLSLQSKASPDNNYGLKIRSVDLSPEWQTFSFDFQTSGFSETTTDAMLGFWFAGLAENGDEYWIDDVRLEEGGAELIPTDNLTDAPISTEISTSPDAVGVKNEVLVFDWNKKVTVLDKGFPKNQPPWANFDWTKPINYAQGTLHYRVQIRSQPVAQDMRLQFCFWQAKNGNNYALENCGPQKQVLGKAGTVVTWSVRVQDMWKLGGKSIEWWRPRFRTAVAIKNSKGKPVSDYNGWNWNGENPKKWYPLDMRFTVVVVAKGSTFSGWKNYIK